MPPGPFDGVRLGDGLCVGLPDGVGLGDGLCVGLFVGVVVGVLVGVVVGTPLGPGYGILLLLDEHPPIASKSAPITVAA